MQQRFDYKRAGLEASLLELVKTLAAGETAQRLFLLDAWRAAPLYSERERAAPDQAYEQARAVFGEKDLASLTLAIISINGWNRLSIAFRMPPTYQRTGK